MLLIVKGLSAKTPQPSPDRSPRLEHDEDIIVGTSDRLSSLRGRCLLRDQHRCIISRQFDREVAIKRFKTCGSDATDDNGLPLINQDMEYLEVAHIIPHSLVSSTASSGILVRFLFNL